MPRSPERKKDRKEKERDRDHKREKEKSSRKEEKRKESSRDKKEERDRERKSDKDRKRARDDDDRKERKDKDRSDRDRRDSAPERKRQTLERDRETRDDRRRDSDKRERDHHEDRSSSRDIRKGSSREDRDRDVRGPRDSGNVTRQTERDQQRRGHYDDDRHPDSRPQRGPPGDREGPRGRGETFWRNDQFREPGSGWGGDWGPSSHQQTPRDSPFAVDGPTSSRRPLDVDQIRDQPPQSRPVTRIPPRHINPTIYVSGFTMPNSPMAADIEVVERGLAQLFRKFGDIIRVSVKDRFAFVQFSDGAAAGEALESTRKTPLMYRDGDFNSDSVQLTVAPSRDRGMGGRGGPGRGGGFGFPGGRGGGDRRGGRFNNSRESNMGL
eukprot:TRINITY_DN67783_c6_g1_i1.p1 TRINITY_DN67783_c6_g1~~TRINITY_DN67783_c6_g1_i1.p1  ORF type:complete len:393 (+),score=21.13 TRINITY_DN67783_c6_g1_i1:36-1181(+)